MRVAIASALLTTLASGFAGAAGNSAPPPTTMNAVVLEDGKAALKQIPTPAPGVGEVLVLIRAASVHPIHWKSVTGYTGLAGTPAPPGPRVLGSDAAGVVAAVGAGAMPWKIGDEVIVTRGSVYAQYAVAASDQLVAKPASLSFAEAAGIPSVAATAWNSIIDVAHLDRGQRILIHGAAGGTGSAAVQIAKARGAYVIGTASPRNRDFLRSIGADEIVDYNTQRFESIVKNVDVVFNTADMDTAVRSLSVVKPGGYLLSIVGTPPAEQCKAARIVCAVRATEAATPAVEVTREILKLVAAHRYAVNVDRTWPLAQFQQAWDYGKLGHTRGKLVLVN